MIENKSGIVRLNQLFLIPSLGQTFNQFLFMNHDHQDFFCIFGY